MSKVCRGLVLASCIGAGSLTLFSLLYAQDIRALPSHTQLHFSLYGSRFSINGNVDASLSRVHLSEGAVDQGIQARLSASASRLARDWRAADGNISTAWICHECVLDPLDYPETFCGPTGATTQAQSSLAALGSFDLESMAFPASSASLVLDSLPNGDRTVIGILGDSFVQQVGYAVSIDVWMLDAFACELRRDGMPHKAGFLKWDQVLSEAGLHNDDTRPRRYNWAGPHGGGPHWYVLLQMHYNKEEVAKLLHASDVVLINYGLHYCQPSRKGADRRCHDQFARYRSDMLQLFEQLQSFATAGRKVAIFQETSPQHFPAATALSEPEGSPPTGDWEQRSFFPDLGLRPPERCRCSQTAPNALPMRAGLIRNLSKGFPAVRLLRLHELLAPRYQWHQQDCKARAEAHATKKLSSQLGCDCTHYCYSAAFWQNYFYALKMAIGF